MKNQYFGDRRDLLKFSLLETLATGLSGIDQLTCVWLLTPPAANNDGNRLFTLRQDPTGLELFLRQRVMAGQRDVRELASYLAGGPLRYFSYRDDPSTYFSHATRSRYFDAIPASALIRSVVFFDPDNGLEPEKSCGEAHLKFKELAAVFARMDGLSAAVVYQHLPRKSPSVFWPELASKLRAVLECSVGYVAAGDVGFLIALRNRAAEAEVASALEGFQEQWPASLLISSPNSAA